MNKIKRIIDVLMLITLMCLMSYQITGEVAHEWIGISMVILVIIHQILNIKWYTAIMKGKYKLFRIFNTIINILLITSFICTAISGISMSNYAVPFLYSLINVNTARVMHLAFSYWSFILMGMHLGMHMGVILTKIPNKIKNILLIIAILVAGYGFCLFIKSGIIDYILFKTHFAFLDYEKGTYMVFIENISMLTFFAFAGSSIVYLIKIIDKKNSTK